MKSQTLIYFWSCKKSLVLWHLLLLPIISVSQISKLDSIKVKALSDSLSEYMTKSPDKAFFYLEQKRKLATDLKWHHKIVETYAQEVDFYFRKNDWSNASKALGKYEEVLAKLKDKLKPKVHYDLEKRCYGQKTNLLIATGKLQEVTILMQKELQLLNNKTNINEDDYFEIFFNNYQLGALNKTTGNFIAASNYMNQAYNTYLKLKEQEPNVKLNILKSLADIFQEKGEFSKANYFFEKCSILVEDSILNSRNIPQFQKQNVKHFYINVITFYQKIKNFGNAQKYLIKLNKLLDDNDNGWINYYHLKAKNELYINNISVSKTNFSKALKSSQAIFGNTRHNNAKIYIDFAKLFQGQSDYIQALANSQSALISLSQQFNSIDYRNNPSVSDVFSKKDLLETLDFKAGLLLDMAKTQPQYLDAAYQTAQLAAGLIDTIRADYTSDFDKQYLAEWSYGVYEKTIESAFQLYQKTGNKTYLNTAFNAFERSKAIVLLEALRTGQAESALNDDDRNKLYQYKSELQKLEAQIYDETTKNKKAPDDPSVRSLQNRLFDIRRNYEALVKSFETRYPEYYRIKFGQNFARLKEIQALLPNDGSTLALEYFVGEKAIYTFSISKNDCQLFKTDKPKDFDTRIEAMRNVLAMNNTQNKQSYITQASWLYHLILKDPLSKNAVLRHFNIKKLIIIPDGVLNYVPFEMLLESDVPLLTGDFKYSNLPFLIKKYIISYAYSGNLLKQQSKLNTTQARDLFAGFAAQYKPQEAPQLAMRAALTRDNAYDLPYAQKEVADIYNIIGGSLFTKDKAGERSFKDNAAFYKILHFAMHAVPDSINPVQSKLLFTYNPSDTIEDNDLTAAEIYAMHLNAQLAVLSACQTGYGKINKGEGVMSLSRAFAYSGVNATLMSLWRVADFSTREIMVEFYKNLKKGQNKDEALRNAKLTYMDNHPEDDLKNPYYWAGFVAAGNMGAMDMTDTNVIRWGAIGALAFFIALILYVRQYKK